MGLFSLEKSTCDTLFLKWKKKTTKTKQENLQTQPPPNQNKKPQPPPVPQNPSNNNKPSNKYHRHIIFDLYFHSEHFIQKKNF